MPEAVERAHMGHPDFRVRGKIFATLGYPDLGSAVVRLRPDQQADFIEADPDTFVPVKGAWGRTGSTCVRLRGASATTVRLAIETAWANLAPERLIRMVESPSGNPASRSRRHRRT